jgi:hypothetical protein
MIKCDWRDMRHPWKRGYEIERFWSETLKERNHLKYLDLHRKALSKLILKKVDGSFGQYSSPSR